MNSGHGKAFYLQESNRDTDFKILNDPVKKYPLRAKTLSKKKEGVLMVLAPIERVGKIIEFVPNSLSRGKNVSRQISSLRLIMFKLLRFSFCCLTLFIARNKFSYPGMHS